VDHVQTPTSVTVPNTQMSTDLAPELTRERSSSQAVADRVMPTVLGLALIAVLGAAGVILAFSSGGYLPHFWIPVQLALTGLTLTLLLAGPPAYWTRWQLALLGAFLAQAAWTASSLLWAGSQGNAWEETNRTFLYLLGFGLAAAGVTWAGRRGVWALVTTCLLTVEVVAACGVFRLATTDSLAPYFTDGRLHYPVTYWNGLASLYMLGFWLALGLASGRPVSKVSMWTKPMLLGSAVILAELALLPQSRGGFYAFFLVVPVFVALSPHRFRAIVDLGVVAGAVALAWGPLTAVYPAVREGGGLEEVHMALWAVLITAGGAVVACTLTWLLEFRLGRLKRCWIRRISVGIAVLALAGAVLGTVGLERRVGNLGTFARATWDQVTADSFQGTGSSTRFGDLGLNGRLQQWRVAGEAFAEQPLLGLGAQNFESFFYQHRSTALSVRYPHSQPMQVLGELGLPGLLLYLFVVLGVLVRAGTLRFRGKGDRRQMLLSAMTVAFLSWLVHSSADWLWQMGGVSWPAVLLLGGLLAASPPNVQRSRRTQTAGPVDTAVLTWDRGGRPLRWLTGGIICLMLVSAGLSFAASQYSDAAQVNSAVSPTTALANARASALFDRLSPLPLIRRAEAYAAGAKGTAASFAPGRAWATLDDLALACTSWEEAVRKEPSNWVSNYRAATSVLDYRDAALAAGALQLEPEASPPVVAPTTPEPWARLRLPDARDGPSDPGAATSSLALSAADRADAAYFRALDAQNLALLAKRYLRTARQLNPLGAEILTALQRI
jgi:hypothetical protein